MTPPGALPNLHPREQVRQLRDYPRQYDRFTPPSVLEQGDGLRPSIEAVLSLIDVSDPAWPATAAVLREMSLAGVELDEPTVLAALKLGRRRWEKGEMAAVPYSSNVSLALASSADAIVYYIRRGTLIKIGTTTDPVQRFGELLPDEILAFEPGTYADESARHRQFRHLRQRGEYFRPAFELTEHVRRLRLLYGDPDPAWPVATTLIDAGRDEIPPGAGEQITALDAVSRLDIKPGTLRGWVHRGKIAPAGRDCRGHQLFFVNQLTYLRENPRAIPARRRASFAREVIAV